LIHIGGAPPMMVHGFAGEEKIVKDMEAKHSIPVSTSGRSQTEAMRALGIRRFVGVTYFQDNMNQIFTRYFTEAGFEVTAMEGIDVAFKDVGRLSGDALACKLWDVQKQFHVREPVKGYGRLLEELPVNKKVSNFGFRVSS